MGFMGEMSAFVTAAVVIGAVCTDAATTPNFKWGQTQAALVLTLDCDFLKEIRPTFLVDFVSITCLKEGKQATLQFSPREDIIVKTAKCVKKGPIVLCTLQKKISHTFDRLAVDMAPLKNFAKLDFNFLDDYADEEEVLQDEDEKLKRKDLPMEYVKSDNVVEFTEVSITQAMHDNDVVVVDVKFPWCKFCQEHRSFFINVSIPGVQLGWMDARENRDFGRKHNISCNNTCEYFIFKQDEGGIDKPYRCLSEPNVTTLTSWFSAFTGPLITQMSVKEAVTEIQRGQRETDTTTVVVAVVGSDDGDDLDNFVRNAAVELREQYENGRVKFHIVKADKVLEYETPAVIVLGSQGLPSLAQGAELMSMAKVNDLSSWIKKAALPRLVEHEFYLRKLYDSLGLPPLHIFVDNVTKALPEFYTELAEKYVGRIGFVLFPGFEYMRTDFGYAPDADYPQIAMAANFSTDSLFTKPIRYVFRGDPLNKEDVEEYLDDFLAGNVDQYYTSVFLPKSYVYKPGTVRLLNGKDMTRKAGEADRYLPTTDPFKLEGVLTSDKDTIIAMYSPDANDVGRLQTFFTKFAKILTGIDNFVVGVFDYAANEFIPGTFPGYDERLKAVYFFLVRGNKKGAKKTIAYNGAVKIKALTSFLKKNSKVIKDNWKTVNAGIKGYNNELSVRKQEAEEEARKKEETIAASEIIDVYGNGQVTKKVYKVSNATALPKKGDNVMIHFHGTLGDTDEVFDSTYGRDPFMFIMGDSKVIKCIEKVTATMSVGESAIVECHPDVAYGEYGDDKKVPPHATLKYDLAMLEFGPAPTDDKDEL